MSTPRVKRLALAAALAALLVPVVAFAQAAPDPRPLLPEPAFFGPGWSVASDTPVVDQDLGAYGGRSYAGPAGARVAVFAVAHFDEPALAEPLWAHLNRAFDALADRAAAAEAVGADRPLPAGCGRARRAAGTDRLFEGDYAVGMTLRGADAGRALLVVASGEVLGLGGVAASDAIVERILAGATGVAVATPAP